MSSIILRRAYRTCILLSRCQSISTLVQSPSTDKPQNHVSAYNFTYANTKPGFSIGRSLINTVPFSTHAAVGPSTSDGLTVDDIVNNQWVILDESEDDWKSHASAIAHSICLIKRRLQWTKLKVRLQMLSFQMEKPDLWDDPVHAAKISREHGSLTGKMKQVNGLEQELVDHIDMIKLAQEENDPELESESIKALLRMRQNVKETELEALLAGEHDSCSCYIEVQAGAGGTESMDWAGMVMQMYEMWIERHGYGVTVVDEMREGNT
ncbi:peptide chain release factor PrfB2, chloroplastic-like [Bidens hawaiensis]|uniref:peptide chain release factor PrfB2, chloroplastic-like n=1 Tax=Bidens hawaiensis TaxID=980011 RepID=UPI00404B098C